jgi:tetratricopeptide (TPR) repeat protein
MLSELELQPALACIERGDNEAALRLFEMIDRRNLTAFEECLILVNEVKCLEVLGRFGEACSRMSYIESLNKDGQFDFFMESAYIDLLFAVGKNQEGIHRGTAFLAKYKEDLAQSQSEYADIAYNIKLKVNCELVSSLQFLQGMEALRSFQSEAREEDRARVSLFLAIAYEQLNMVESAVDELRTTLTLDPIDDDVLAMAHYRLGALYLKQDAAHQAKEQFLAAEALKHSLIGVPLSDLYKFLAAACGYLGEKNEQARYLELARKFYDGPVV